MKPHVKQSRGTRPLSELVAGVLAPMADRRGYLLANLKAAWPEIAGARYAACTEPERIDWPRAGDAVSGVLRIRADGPKAVLLQHELDQLVERVNAFVGYGAIRGIRLVQGPVARRPRPPLPQPPAVDETRLAAAVGGVSDEPLTAALARLGRGVFAKRT
jgi:hypothetical protein